MISRSKVNSVRSEEEILHKMKSPLTSITGYSSMLSSLIKNENSELSREKLLSLVDGLKKSAQSLVKLMNDLDQSKQLKK